MCDIWLECPKCSKRNKRDYISGERELGGKYGKISVDEWLSTKESLDDLGKERLSLKCMYSVWIENNELRVQMSSYCRASGCDFRVKIKKTVSLSEIIATEDL